MLTVMAWSRAVCDRRRRRRKRAVGVQSCSPRHTTVCTTTVYALFPEAPRVFVLVSRCRDSSPCLSTPVDHAGSRAGLKGPERPAGKCHHQMRDQDRVRGVPRRADEAAAASLYTSLPRLAQCHLSCASPRRPCAARAGTGARARAAARHRPLRAAPRPAASRSPLPLATPTRAPPPPWGR